MHISYEQERRLVTGILRAAQYSEEDADLISRVISHSDFTGVASHGLSRLARHLEARLHRAHPAPSQGQVFLL